MTASTAPPSTGRAVAHLVAFDLRRFRVPIAVLTGLELLRAAMGEWSVQGGPIGETMPTGSSPGVFEFQTIDGVLRIAAAIVVALLVQADHPADDRGFLRSRPIATWTHALAKLTLVAALVSLLPFVITAARLIAYGAPATALAASLVQFAVIGGGLAVPVWIVALFARTLPRFLSACAGVVVAWGVTSAVVTSIGWYRWPDFGAAFRARGGIAGFAAPLTDWQHAEARGWLFALAMTIAASACLVDYYRRGRARGPLLAGGALVIAPALLPVAASRPTAADLEAIAQGDLRLLDGVELPSAAVVTSNNPKAARLPMRARLALAAPLPTTVSASIELSDARLATEGGTTVAAGDAGCCLDYGDYAAWTVAAAATMPAGPIGPPRHAFDASEGSAARRVFFDVAAADVGRLRGHTVDVAGSARLDLARHRLSGALPLRPGASLRTDAYLVEVRDVDADGRTATLRFTRFPSLATYTLRPVHVFLGEPRGTLLPTHLWLDAPQTSRISWAHGRTWSRHVTVVQFVMGPAKGRPERPDRIVLVDAEPAGSLRLAVVGQRLPVLDVDMPPFVGRRF